MKFKVGEYRAVIHRIYLLYQLSKKVRSKEKKVLKCVTVWLQECWWWWIRRWRSISRAHVKWWRSTEIWVWESNGSNYESSSSFESRRKKKSDILVMAVQRPKQQLAERTECLQIEQLLLQILHSLCTWKEDKMFLLSGFVWDVGTFLCATQNAKWMRKVHHNCFQKYHAVKKISVTQGQHERAKNLEEVDWLLFCFIESKLYIYCWQQKEVNVTFW